VSWQQAARRSSVVEQLPTLSGAQFVQAVEQLTRRVKPVEPRVERYLPRDGTLVGGQGARQSGDGNEAVIAHPVRNVELLKFGSVRYPLLDVVHRRAGLAVLALDHIGDGRARKNLAGGRGGVGEDPGRVAAQWAVE
jgi:hypothetical protein